MQSGMQSQDSTVLLSATARHFSRARTRIYKRKRFGADRTERWSCVKVEVAVLWLPVPKKLDGFCGREATFEEEDEAYRTEFRSCVKVEVAAFGSLSLKSLMVSVDVKQHLKKKTKRIEQSSGAV